MTDGVSTTTRNPQTEAGKALLEWAENAAPNQLHIWRDHAVAIEDEARRDTVKRIKADLHRLLDELGEQRP